jgi:hypothetical protein
MYNSIENIIKAWIVNKPLNPSIKLDPLITKNNANSIIKYEKKLKEFR